MRGKNEGSVFKAGKYWRAQLLLPGEGKARYAQVQRKTQHEALAALDEMKRKVKAKEPLKSPTRTVGELMTEFFEVYGPVNLRDTTVRGYEQTARVHLIPALGHIKLAELSRADVARWIASLKKKKIGAKKKLTEEELVLWNRAQTKTLSAATIKRNVATLKTALSWAVDMAYIGHNVAYRIGTPQVPEYETQPLSEDSATLYLLSLYGHRYEAAPVGGCALGLRRGEVAALQWSDFNFDEGFVHVKNSLSRVKNRGVVLGPVKSARSNRKLHLSPALVEVFQRRRELQEKERAAAGPRWKPRKGMEGTDFVFTSEGGSVIQPEAVWREHTAALERAGVPHVRFHDLRHTLGHILLSKGGNMKHVSEALGHSTVQFTIDRYAKSRPRDVSGVVQTMSDLVFKPSTGPSTGHNQKVTVQ